MYLLFLPLFATGLIVIPFISLVLKKKAGKKINAKRAIRTNAIAFIGCMAAFAVMCPLGVFAETGTAVVTDGLTEGLKYLGAALSTGLATIGTGIAVGGAAPAAIGATCEDDKNFTKALIFVALGEGVAIYGLLISILILFS